VTRTASHPCEARGVLFADYTVLIRSGGDLATGVAVRMHRAGFPVVVTELAAPLTVRRSVSLSSAVLENTAVVEGVVGRLATPEDAVAVTRAGEIPVIVSAELPQLAVSPSIVVDARLAKRNIDTTRDDAELVVALGPGFHAGADCDAVIETARGHRLGRTIWSGPAEPNTGTPGIVGGRGRERVLRAPRSGTITWEVDIGATVIADQVLGSMETDQILAPFDGLVRGLISPSTTVDANTKVGDIDPRIDPEACHQISDKALAIGGGVLEAALTWLNRSS
jgi:xanthine dehydrogenase accessory factor